MTFGMLLFGVGAGHVVLVVMGLLAAGMALTFRIPSNSVDYNQYNAIGNLDLFFGTQTAAADGAIGIKEGTVFVTKASAAALTLAAPAAGAQSAGGDDGRELVVIDTTGYAHTVTTPANAINGTKHIVTMQSGSPLASAAGTMFSVRAFNGKWYMNPGASGVTIS
jgi:hypothetical protein